MKRNRGGIAVPDNMTATERAAEMQARLDHYRDTLDALPDEIDNAEARGALDLMATARLHLLQMATPHADGAR